MPTKQEIIDYIKKHCYWVDSPTWDEDHCIKMIKDLKPKVKKLDWQIIEDNSYIHYRGIDHNKDIFCNIRHHKFLKGLYMLMEADAGFYTLEKAQEACQKHYEETILGALEDHGT